MKKIKIGYFADGPWSHEAFKAMINDKNIDIRFIVPRVDTQDETLKRFSEQYKIDYFKHKNINSPEFIELVKKYDCDLFVSMSFNQIFKEEIINLPKYKTINCHAGKLPFYRGRNILNWALINDEKEFGITVHYVDAGIDTGDILFQKNYPITDNDDYNTILNTAYTGCSASLHEAVKLIQAGNIKLIRQRDIHPVGFYCGVRGVGDEILNWNQPSRAIFCFVRAVCIPGPIARAFLNGSEMKINKVRMIENAPTYIGTVGQIVGKNGNSFIVKTLDTTIEVVEFEYDGKIKIGDRFTKS